MKNKNKKLISQADAADIRKVSRQAIHKLSRRVWGFFVGDEIDANHEHWKIYLSGNKPQKVGRPTVEVESKSGNRKGKKEQVEKSKSNVTEIVGRQTNVKSKIKDPEGILRHVLEKEFSLTGGVNPEDIQPASPRDIKTITEISKINLEMLIKLDDFVLRTLVDDRFSKIWRLIQTGFIDSGRRVSKKITTKLKRVGAEKQVEKIVNNDMAKAMENLKIVFEKYLKLK